MQEAHMYTVRKSAPETFSRISYRRRIVYLRTNTSRVLHIIGGNTRAGGWRGWWTNGDSVIDLVTVSRVMGGGGEETSANITQRFKSSFDR